MRDGALPKTHVATNALCMKRFLHRALVATWVLGNAPSRISSAFEFFLWIGEPFATLPPSKAGVRQFTAFPEIFFSLFFAARSFPHSSPDIPYDFPQPCASPVSQRPDRLYRLQ